MIWGKLIRSGIEQELAKYLNPCNSPEADLSEAMQQTKLRVCEELIKKHVDIDVSATPEQILKQQVTIKLTALDQVGEQLINNGNNISSLNN